MSLSGRLSEYVRAAFSGIWIQSHEHDDALLEVAQLFSQFYRDCRVLPDDPTEIPLSRARLALTDAVRQVLANGLALLGISAPESM